MSLAALIILYAKSRSRHILWFAGQLLFLGAAFRFFFRAVCTLPVPGFSMYTEEQTLTLAYAGVCWTVSMVFLLIGIYKLLRVVYQF